MLYFDQDYKYDCLNKISYDKLKPITSDSAIIQHIDEKYASYKIYVDSASNNKIFIINTNFNTDFWVKDILYCKEIAPNLFKVVLK